MPLAGRVLGHMQARPRASAFVMGDAVQDYARLGARASRVVAATAGLARRERSYPLNETAGGRLVAVAVGNHPAFAELFVGASAGNNACAVIDPNWSRAQFEAILPRLQPDLLVAAAADTPAFEVAAAHGIPALTADGRDYEGWLASTDPADPARWLKTGDRDATFLVGFTSGTTSLPKAFHRNNDSWRISLDTGRDIFGVDPAGATFAPGPLAHGLALYALAEALDAGAAFVGMPAFKAAPAAATLAGIRPDRLVVVPAMLSGLAGVAESAGLDGDSVKTVIAAGDKLDARLRARTMAAFPEAEVIEYYGASELGHVAVRHGADGVADDSVGRPHPAVAVGIRDDRDRPVKTGIPGTVFVHSPLIADGYLWGDDGSGLRRVGEWATVGDVGYLAPDGALHLVGRAGGMIVTGGYNVYPAEVEKALRRMPGVTEAVALGLPDAYLGQRLVAVIGGPGAGEATFDGVAAHCREALPRYAAPRAVWTALEWPTTGSGKIARKTLEDWIRDGDPRLRPLPSS